LRADDVFGRKVTKLLAVARRNAEAGENLFGDLDGSGWFGNPERIAGTFRDRLLKESLGGRRR
jgi:hypothetical protein